MTTAELIAKILLKLNAVNPPFTWSSGLRTPIYCDNRLINSYPVEREQIVEGLKNLIKKNNIEFDVIAGTATAAISWAAFLAQVLSKPMVYVRPKPKGYGAGKQVEGTMKKGSRVLIVEDLISTGASALQSAVACKREYNAVVTNVIAIFTYQMQKAKDAFVEANVTLHTLSDFSKLVEIATKEKYLSEEDKAIALEWSKDPQAWSDAHK